MSAVHLPPPLKPFWTWRTRRILLGAFACIAVFSLAGGVVYFVDDAIARKRRFNRVPYHEVARPPGPVTSKQQKDTGLARARRVEGLVYLEAGKYDKAIDAFSDALRLDSMGELGDLADLMKIAKSLQDSGWPREDAP